MKDTIVNEDKVPEGKVTVIRHGDYEIYTRWAGKDIPEHPATVLFFGRLYAYKGVEYLIQAAPEISREVPGVRFIIAGTGSNRYCRKIRGLIRGNPQFIFIHKYISDRQVANLFRLAALLVLPYVDASQSGPLMISSAFRKPAVATRVGSLSEYIEHGRTGYLVPPADTRALTESIIRLLSDESLRHRMGNAAYEKMRVEFSWEEIGRRTVKIYEKAMGNKIPETANE